MYQVSKIDGSGNYAGPVLVEDAGNLPAGLIAVPVPQGFYHPKWNGSEWEEGKSSDEIAAIKKASEDSIVQAQAQAVASDPRAMEIAELTAMVAQLSATVAQIQPKS